MLTGGTGDVSPQLLTMTVTQTAADTTTTAEQIIPVQRLPQGNKAQVMEVLKVYYDHNNTGEVDQTLNCFLTTASFGTTAITAAEPRVFSFFRKTVQLTTSGMYIEQFPFTHDLTDGAGHGILIATDSIFMQAVSATTGAANTFRIKILYRWKNVLLPEYIGIVQSQQ